MTLQGVEQTDVVFLAFDGRLFQPLIGECEEVEGGRRGGDALHDVFSRRDLPYRVEEQRVETVLQLPALRLYKACLVEALDLSAVGRELGVGDFDTGGNSLLCIAGTNKE